MTDAEFGFDTVQNSGSESGSKTAKSSVRLNMLEGLVPKAIH